MNKEVVLRIKEYLKENGIADTDGNKSNSQLRAEGKTFTLSEHVGGMILALISGQNKWYRVERQLENIKKLFCDYEADEILKHDGDYYFKGLQRLGANGRFAERQMAEVCHNVKVLKSIESEYGSVDAFLEGRPVDEVVKTLSNPRSKYKFNQMSIALVCEYLRNVGIDTAKPDEHMKRMLGAGRLGVSTKEEASEYEVISEFYRLSKETGMWAADIDYLFWCYCAEEKAEICGKNPKCDKCVIKEFCNRNATGKGEEVKVEVQPRRDSIKKAKVKAPSKNKELEEYRLRIDCKDCIYYDSSDKSCMKRPLYLPVDGYNSWRNCNYFELDQSVSHYDEKKAQYCRELARRKKQQEQQIQSNKKT